MANYIIIGGDGKEYGPVTDADVRQWITEGRLNAHTRAKGESDAEFRPLAQFPEFAGALGLGTPPPFSTPPPIPRNEFAPHDYELDIGGCISRGWNLLTNQFGTLFVGVLLYFLIEMAIGVFSNIPIIGIAISLGNFVISGPLMAGVFYLFIRANREEPVQAGEIFAGFSRGFVHSFLAVLVQGILIGLCMVPFLIIFFIRLFPLLEQMQPHGATVNPDAEMEQLKAMLPTLAGALPWLFLCLIPTTYLSVCWKFTLPLIVDKEMDFFVAMKTSWKMVNKHWWHVFGLIVLLGLINLAGAIACCVGLLFTMPLSYGALRSAYETFFGDEKM
jgi:uncharacterized membrane protein